ncbi:conjugal transfer protein TraN [Sphingomonas sp. H39-1-10]|uniref:conjugal transfer protein TraN n=1 Tax=Sphingomonas pollutisoli TaxID=3030829 RepID=UPI0023B9DB6B|nr:conjugal transfer protein TraN [Sphingomonas pollutisoli]MDF0490458.1 conjugal transfer protein TraN [Sphingomonas pollutisoli]
MRPHRLAALLVMLTALPVIGQTTREQAREEGRTLAEEARKNGALVPSEESQAEVVPGYAGTTLPQSTYFDDPDKLVSDASAAAVSNDSYRTVTDPDKLRPTFGNAEILATTHRATAIENDPSTYLEGESYGGTAGSCTPLPPSAGAEGYYEASCNTGTKVESAYRYCQVPLVAEGGGASAYHYYVAGDTVYGAPFPREGSFTAALAAGTCRATGKSLGGCPASTAVGLDPNKFCGDYSVREIVCSAEMSVSAGPGTFIMPITGQHWFAREAGGEPELHQDESACAAYAGNAQCSRQIDICTEGNETRIINGVPVNQNCWAWRREYSCNELKPADDCSDLEGNAACTFDRNECLDEDPGGGPCKVTEKVYRCPVPGGPAASDKQYICGDDVYCINGDCEPIVREASTEFKDALVALHALGQAGDEFDPANLTVFSGERDTCHKPVFGLINCCAGKVSGLLTVGAGAAALAGGPAAIAAVATPFLTLFACSTEEKMLDIKDRMGFCHNLGTYCSSSFLGICSTKRTAYCCFESKLSRILQEQGRVQLGKPWDSAKKEQCKGFSIDEFARLDLSKMDFTEVYAEFMDAAKLPDEIETIADIQSKITNYYELHGAPGGP